MKRTKNIGKSVQKSKKKDDFAPKEKLHYLTVNNFFKQAKEKNIDEMLSIINSKSKISLRLLDWFVTRYAKQKKVCYDIDGEPFHVYISYKAQLKAYKKRYFDPFRRRKKFYYSYNNNKKKEIITTIGQLNFFKWAIEYKILDYVKKNYDMLVKSMITNKTPPKPPSTTVTVSGVTVTAEEIQTNEAGEIYVSFY